jgi:UDP-glucose 4-epimerase
MKSKKISLITGGAGFIGSHLVDLLLSKNHEVRVIDDLSGGHYENIKHHKNNKKFFFIKKNINFLDKNERIFKDVQYVFHLAGKGDIVPSIENPIDYMETNVMGTTRVLENCRNLNLKKFIYAASSSCYGLAKTPTNESHPISTLYPYALSKYIGEQTCFHWSSVYKIPVNSIRIFNAYGTRVKTTGVYGAVFGVFLKQKLKDKHLTIVGNGLQKRDFLYVTDVANAFYLLSQSKYVNNIYNLGAGKPVKIIKLAKLLSDKFKFIRTRPGEPNCTWASIEKIKKHTNWKPKVTFNLGIKLMLQNIQDWKNAPLWDTRSINKATKTWFKYLS